MKATKRLNVEVLQKKFLPTIDAVQFVTGLQIIMAVKDFSVPTGTTAKAFFKKPSGKFVYQDCTISGNEITIDVHNQALTEYGNVYYQVKLTNGSDILSTFAGKIEVEKSLADSSATSSETVVPAFDAAVQDAVTEIEEARDSAITYIGNGLDNTLKVEGKAADAAATGKAIDELKEDITHLRTHSKNIFEGKIVQGNINNSGADSDSDSAKEYYVRTDSYIRIDGEYIALSFTSPMNKAMLYFYDSSNNFISNVINGDGYEGGNKRRKFVGAIPADAKFVRFVAFGSGGATKYTPSQISEIQVEMNREVTDYVNPYVANDFVARQSVDVLYSETIEYFNKVGIDKLNILTKFADGGYWTDVFNQSVNYSHTDRLKIKPNTRYAVCAYMGDRHTSLSPIVSFWDKYGVFISWHSSGFESGDGCMIITTPDTADTMYVSTSKYIKNIIFMCEGDTVPSAYNDGTVDLFSINRENVLYEYAMNNILCIGDSLTYGLYVDTSKGGLIQNYPYFLGRMLNTNVERMAVSGGAPSTIYNGAYQSADFTKYDAVIIWLGTNGGLNSIDTPGTDANYYKLMIDGIQEQNPNCIIVLANVFTTGRLHDDVPEISVETTNATIAELASRYSLHVVDMTDLRDVVRPDLRNGVNNNTHFGKAGNIYIADRFCKSIRKYLADNPTRCEFGLHFAN